MHKNLVSFVITILLTLLVSLSSRAATLGNTNSSEIGTGFATEIRGNTFTASVSFTGTHIAIYFVSYTPGGAQMRVAVYSTSGGVPQNLLSESNPQTIVPEWNYLPLISPVTVSSGNRYYLGLQLSSATDLVGATPFGEYQQYIDHAWGNFPNVFGPPGSNPIDMTMSIYLTDTPATPTPTPSFTRTDTPTVTRTSTETPIYTVTASPSITPTRTISPTSSNTPTITATRTTTPTCTITPTITTTPTISPTYTITPTITMTPTISPTCTITPTITATPTISPTCTITPTITATPTISPTCSITPTATCSMTPSMTQTPGIKFSTHEAIAYPQPAVGRELYFYYYLPESASVDIVIYNILGEKVISLHENKSGAGNHRTVWNIHDAAPGIYLYCISCQLDSGRRMKFPRKKLVIVKTARKR